MTACVLAGGAGASRGKEGGRCESLSYLIVSYVSYLTLYVADIILSYLILSYRTLILSYLIVFLSYQLAGPLRDGLDEDVSVRVTVLWGRRAVEQHPVQKHGSDDRRRLKVRARVVHAACSYGCCCCCCCSVCYCRRPKPVN